MGRACIGKDPTPTAKCDLLHSQVSLKGTESCLFNLITTKTPSIAEFLLVPSRLCLRFGLPAKVGAGWVGLLATPLSPLSGWLLAGFVLAPQAVFFQYLVFG